MVRAPDSVEIDEIPIKKDAGEQSMADFMRGHLKAEKSRITNRRRNLLEDQTNAEMQQVVEEAKGKGKEQKTEAAAENEDAELNQVLEQWRVYLLSDEAKKKVGGTILSETGTALSIKELAKHVPEVSQLTPEHLKKIREMQKEIYLKSKAPEIKLAEDRPRFTAKEKHNPKLPEHGGDFDIGQNVGTFGIYAGRAKNGDLLFLDPGNESYLDSGDVERVVDLDLGRRVTLDEAREVMASPKVLRELEKDTFEAAKKDLPRQREAFEKKAAKDKSERKERMERAREEEKTQVYNDAEMVGSMTEETMDNLRVYMLEQGVLDEEGNVIADIMLGVPVEDAVRPHELAWAVKRQKAIAAERKAEPTVREKERTPYKNTIENTDREDAAAFDEGDIDEADQPTEVIALRRKAAEQVEAEDEEEFAVGKWYQLKVGDRKVRMKYMANQGHLMKFISEKGEQDRSAAFSTLLNRGDAVMVRPEEAEAMRFAAEEQKEAA